MWAALVTQADRAAANFACMVKFVSITIATVDSAQQARQLAHAAVILFGMALSTDAKYARIFACCDDSYHTAARWPTRSSLPLC